MSFEIPILLLAFKRPETTKQVINAIRKVKPTQIFVTCDGPRKQNPTEEEACKATRHLIDQEIDWHCDIQRLYREENLGCRRSVSTAISWFFEQVDKGIILEDDLLPDVSFFKYCAELLVRYYYDERIGVISGNNFHRSPTRDGSSYYFSIYNHCWGWASWRRAWQHYDWELESWPAFRDQGWLEDLGGKRFANYWTKRLDGVWCGSIDSWAYIWTYSCWKQGYLTCLPAVNLVSNVGFGEAATHTKSQRSSLDSVSELLFPLTHPLQFLANNRYDKYVFNRFYQASFYNKFIIK